MTKVNNNTMREQYDGQYKTFCKKNSDYGNSFEESLDKHGIVASVVRMGDKMNRLEALTDDSRTQQVGSESLLDTLEDLSNYAAMTACWLKGVRAEDGEEEEVTHVYTFGQDEPYMTFRKPKKEIPDDENVVDAMRYAAEDMMNDPIIRKRINEEIISYSLDAIIELMVDDIKRQRDPKVKLDERQRIVDRREKYYQKIARFIRNAPNIAFADFERYFNTRADLHSYERQLIIEGVAEELDSQIDKELEKFKAQFMESLESNANSISIKQQGEIRLISNAMKGIMSVLIPNVLAQRNPKYDVNAKLTQANKRNECYKEIASLILSTPWLSFDGFSGYVDTFRELTPEEKQLIKESVATEIYSQTDKNPGGDEESEFRSKKFNIPTEETKTENLTFKPQKEDEEEKEPLNEKMFKAILWLFHPIIDKNYRGGRDE
nr:MAG TPA: Nucleotide modification associated domain 1 [Caudoviricetes sp.]